MELLHSNQYEISHASKDKKIAFFDRFFSEKSVFGGVGNDFGMENSAVKKS